MFTRSVLLGTTALAGMAVLATTAEAGNVSTGDTYTVKLSGKFGYNLLVYDQDVSAGRGRGYGFQAEDTDIYIDADARVDKDLTYGIKLTLDVRGDAPAIADEAFGYINSDDWGRVELGESDDAISNMLVSGETVLVGQQGWYGLMFGVVNVGTGGGLVGSSGSQDSDATLLSYYTPSVAGFKLGISLTPDTGVNGRFRPDNFGATTNLWDIAAAWKGKVEMVGVTVTAGYEAGDRSTLTGPGSAPMNDTQIASVGAQVDIGRFSLAAGYADVFDSNVTRAVTAGGGDGGRWWNIGARYTMGAWAGSLGYLDTGKGNPAGISDTTWQVVSADVTYNVAPGWTLMGELNYFEGGNINATAQPVGNSGTVAILTSSFAF
jgi:outer membrane protein OmpU